MLQLASFWQREVTAFPTRVEHFRIELELDESFSHGTLEHIPPVGPAVVQDVVVGATYVLKCIGQNRHTLKSPIGVDAIRQSDNPFREPGGIGSNTAVRIASVTNSGTSSAAKLDFLIPRGTDGAAATVAVGTVITGAAGSAATVTNSGSTSAAVLNFKIPKGDQGDPGPSYLKAWVYFTVSGGVATVRAQNNVSSVTRNAAGNYTITFSTAMLGNLYTATGTADNLSGFREPHTRLCHSHHHQRCAEYHFGK